MAALRLDVVVFLYSKLEILSPQIQSTPAQGSAFWLRPSGRAMMIDDTALALAFLVSLGAFTGFLSGMLGIGGGIVVVPALIVGLPVLGVEAPDMTKIAVGSSLAIVVPTALASAQAHAGKNSIDWHVLVLLTPSFMAGAFVIAAFMGGLNTNLIILVFILFAFYSAVRMLRGWRRPAMPLRRPGLVELTVKGVLGGALSSLLGLGVGMVGVSLMERFVSLQRAIGTASALAVPMALSGTAAYLVAPQACPTCIGFVYPPAVAAIGISAVLAAPLGAWAAHALPVHALKKIFALFLIIAAVSLAYKTFTREVIAAETARFAALGKRLMASQVTAARAAEVPLWIGYEPAQVPYFALVGRYGPQNAFLPLLVERDAMGLLINPALLARPTEGVGHGFDPAEMQADIARVLAAEPKSKKTPAPVTAIVVGREQKMRAPVRRKPSGASVGAVGTAQIFHRH